jgi:hypothetical protein
MKTLISSILVLGSVLFVGCSNDQQAIYTIVCEAPESKDTCKVIDTDGITVADISLTEAEEYKLFSHPKELAQWVQDNNSSYI